MVALFKMLSPHVMHFKNQHPYCNAMAASWLYAFLPTLVLTSDLQAYLISSIYFSTSHASCCPSSYLL